MDGRSKTIKVPGEGYEASFVVVGGKEEVEAALREAAMAVQNAALAKKLMKPSEPCKGCGDK